MVVNKCDYPQFEWNTDLYKMFYEIAIKSLMTKKGYLCYITPKFWMLNLEDEKIRTAFEKQLFVHFVAFCNPFESVVTENTIILLSNINIKKEEIDLYKYDEEKKTFQRLLPLNLVYCSTNLHKEWTTGVDTGLIKILTKMSCETTLKDISISKRGAEVSKKVLRETKTGIPSLIGQDMKKYSISWNNTFMDVSHKEYKRLVSFFDSNMIYLRRVDTQLEAAISDSMFAFSKNVYGIKIDEIKGFSTKYVLALINSRALNFYYKTKFSTKKEDVFPEIQTYLYEQLPIPMASKQQQEDIALIVNKIIALKQMDTNSDVSLLESQINNYVYELFGLNEDEIKIVEGE